ncbi:MAG: SH3 domain-containing protein [Candidatus Omnitrophota bacterium]|jgi:hypothetical protein
MAMKTAGYWIKRHPYPDKLILDYSGIAKLNAYIREMTGVNDDLSVFPELIPGKTLQNSLLGQLRHFRSGRYYSKDGLPAAAGFYSRIEANMDFSGLEGDIAVRFAYMVNNADQRLLPVEDGLNELPFDFDFDELQNSSLAPGTPVAVLHASRDGKWYYVSSSVSSGWVEADKTAFCARNEIEEPDGNDAFVVVTSARTDIYLDPGLTEYYDYARMGDRFILKESTPLAAEVVLFCRNPDSSLKRVPGYIAGDDVSRGYLPYTPRNAIRQAFKLLNTPYGWGGMYGEQDCSQFIREVFSVMGIKLPRNSAAQAQVGVLLAGASGEPVDDKAVWFSRKVPGGITTICLNGHIMLFLGMDNGRPYAIHDAWAYRVKGPRGEDEVRLINRVAVTGLELGEGSRKGSLLNRTKCLRMIALEKP